MPIRGITPKDLNRLFSSPEFIRRVEASGKPSADVFLEATDEEVKHWLAEGARMERQIRQEVAGTAALRGIRGVLAGFATVVGAMVVAALVWPEFRYALGPGTQWQLGSQTFGWPAPVIVYLIICGLPAIIAGPLTARLATNRVSMWAGLIGIAIGCWWHFHLSALDASVASASMHGGSLVSVERLDGPWLTHWFINAEYDLLVNCGTVFAIVEFLLPLICSITAVLTMNYWVRCWRGERTA